MPVDRFAMFDIGWGEFVVIGAVALVVIGPKELPSVLRTVGGAVSKIRRMAGEFQSQFQEAIREADLAEARKTVEGLNDTVSSPSFNPIQSIRDEIKNAVEGKTETRPYAGPVEAPPDYNFPPPPPVPDLTPEQIQAAFAPEPAALPAPDTGADADAPPAAKPRRKRLAKPAADAAEPLPPEAPADVAAADAAVEAAPKPKRRARKAPAKTPTDDEGAAG